MSLSTMQSTRLFLAGIGGMQGLIFYLRSELTFASPWLGTSMTALCIFVTVAGLSVQYGCTGQAYRRLMCLAMGLGLLFAAITFWVAQQI